ncbi:MAG: phosphotransacetylase family protein [Cyanobacteria bacterium P01_D01_bin.128]
MGVPKPAKHLLVGSTEAYSGKSAIILGIAFQLQERGVEIAYGKPLGTCLSESPDDILDEDVRFLADTLKLSSERLRKTLLTLDDQTIQTQLADGAGFERHRLLADYHNSIPNVDITLIEGPSTLEEGLAFNLSLTHLAEVLDAPVILVARYRSPLVVDRLVSAKQRLGDRLLGVVLNDAPEAALTEIETTVKPYLQKHQITFLGALPQTPLMRSVSVGELVSRLKAEVLCCDNRLDLMVESLTVGAMNVSSALRYFRKATNMAVVTGGDRTDIQLAALETSTQCLILTGHLPPSPQVLSRAIDLEIPILSVDLDTLSTVEIIDQTFGQVRFHEPIKIECLRHLMTQHFDINPLLDQLGLSAVSA